MKYFSEEDKKRILANRLNKEEAASGDRLRYYVATMNGPPHGVSHRSRSFISFEEAAEYFDKQVAIPRINKRHFKVTLRKVVTKTEKLREVEIGEDE